MRAWEHDSEVRTLADTLSRRLREVNDSGREINVSAREVNAASGPAAASIELGSGIRPHRVIARTADGVEVHGAG